MNTQTLLQPLQEMWSTIAVNVPKFFVAIIIFAIGWMLAQLLYKLIAKGVAKLQLDKWLRPTGLNRAIERAGYKLDLAKVFAFLAKWLLIIIALQVSLDILSLDNITELLSGIISYIPRVIISIFILFIGFVVADFTKKIVKASTKMFNFKFSGLLSNIARIAIIVFALLITLNLLGIGATIVNTIFIGVVAMLSLAGGLAFGLGGQKAAADLIEKVKSEMHK